MLVHIFVTKITTEGLVETVGYNNTTEYTAVRLSTVGRCTFPVTGACI